MMKSIKWINSKKKKGGIMKFFINYNDEIIGGRLGLRECY